MSVRLPLSTADLRVLHAVMAEHATQGRTTVRGVACRVGLSNEPTLRRLRRLRRAGLVAWEDGTMGTLRPLVRCVPFGEKAA